MKGRAFGVAALVLAGCADAKGSPPSGILALEEALSRGRVLATVGFSWPNGRQGALLYIRVGDSVYRCREYFDADMAPTGDLCLSFAASATAEP